MKFRNSVAVPASAGVIAVALFMTLGSASAFGSPVSGEEQPEVARIGQMVFVPGDASGPDPVSLEAAHESGGFTTTVEIPSGLSEKEETALIDETVSDLDSPIPAPGKGEMSTNATDTVTGSCGWSSVTLQDAGTRRGYYQARVGLNRAGTTFTMNEHVWDPSWTDPSSWSWTDSGSFGGATSWSDDFTFSVDSSSTYSAELDGEVYVGNGWCVTTGAQVNSVSIT